MLVLVLALVLAMVCVLARAQWGNIGCGSRDGLSVFYLVSE